MTTILELQSIAINKMIMLICWSFVEMVKKHIICKWKMILITKFLLSPQAAEVVAPTPALGKNEGPPLERRTIKRHAVGAANQNWARGLEDGARGHPVSWAIKATAAQLSVKVTLPTATPTPGSATASVTASHSIATPPFHIATPPLSNPIICPVPTVREVTALPTAHQVYLHHTALLTSPPKRRQATALPALHPYGS